MRNILISLLLIIPLNECFSARKTSLFEVTKESFYQAGDFLQSIPPTLSSLPLTLQTHAKKSLLVVKEVPESVQTTVQFLAVIPSELVQESKELAEKAANFPAFVSSSTSSSIESLKSNVESKHLKIQSNLRQIQSNLLLPFRVVQKIVTFFQSLQGKGTPPLISNTPSSFDSEIEDKPISPEEFSEEELKELEIQAAIRRANLENTLEKQMFFDSLKDSVYGFFDTVEAAVINIKEAPVKIEAFSMEVNKKVQEVQSIPSKLSALQQNTVTSVNSVVTSVKETPEKISHLKSDISQKVTAFQSNLAKTQRNIISAGEYFIRVITLQEAKKFYEETVIKVEKFKIGVQETKEKLKNPSSFFISKPKEKKKNPLAPIITVGKGVYQVLRATGGALGFVATSLVKLKDNPKMQKMFLTTQRKKSSNKITPSEPAKKDVASSEDVKILGAGSISEESGARKEDFTEEED